MKNDVVPIQSKMLGLNGAPGVDAFRFQTGSIPDGAGQGAAAACESVDPLLCAHLVSDYVPSATHKNCDAKCPNNEEDYCAVNAKSLPAIDSGVRHPD